VTIFARTFCRELFAFVATAGLIFGLVVSAAPALGVGHG
jgi:hypothetical protein